MTWSWRLESADGTPLTTTTGQASAAHQTQSDAETWIGESWRTLAEEGVAQATLFCDGRLVYGPMALAE
jgi:hypothetical protein